jgi:hypothetical protein
MRRRQALSISLPFVFVDPYAYGSPKAIYVAAVEVGDGYFCVTFRLGEQQIVAVSVKKEQIGPRYSLSPETSLSESVASLKRQGLKFGATLEAIQLLGTLTSLTTTEEAMMADAKKLARKEELKAAAKEAPVKGNKAAATGDAPKKKGNPEALAAARAAKDSGPDNRKITVLKKDHGARDGTKRADLLNKIFKNKTVQAAVDAGVKKSDVSWAAREGYISLS